MQLPTPPTDSLYKFMAVAGVVVVILSLSVPTLFLMRMRPRLTTLRTESRIISLEAAYLREDIERAAGLPLKELASRDIDPGQTAKLRELETRQVRLDESLSEAEWATNEIRGLWAVLLLGGGFGSYLARKGFTLWYERQQRFHDQLAELQTLELVSKGESESHDRAESA